MFNVVKELLVSEKELSKTNYERLEKSTGWHKNNLIDSDRNMYLIMASLIKTNNLITWSDNITLRKVTVKLYRFDKIYMDKDLIEDQFYQIIDQFNERKNTAIRFYLIFLTKYIHFMMETAERVRNCLLMMIK